VLEPALALEEGHVAGFVGHDLDGSD
jgi:hypothetical protein